MIISFKKTYQQYNDHQVEGSVYKPLERNFLSQFNLSHPRLEIDQEVDLYFSEPLQIFKDDDDILKYWQSRSSDFPTLSKIALDYLPIQISSAVIEQKFSISNNLLQERRNRLSSDCIEACMLLQNWMKDNLTF